MKLSKKVIALGVCAMLLVSLLAACGGSEGSKNTTKAGENTPGESSSKEIVELDFMYVGGWPDAGKEDSAIIKEIERLTGVRMTFSFADNDKKQVIFAGGDTTDCLVIYDQLDISTAIQGGLLLPLNDLIDKHGPNVKSVLPERLRMGKDFLSDGSSNIYALPCHAGSEGRAGSIYHSIFLTRWDYYKELGYPQIKNIDEYLQLLKDMVDAHPVTDDGRPVYGMSFVANTPRSFFIPFHYTFGYYQSNDFIATHIADGKMVYNYVDEDSPYWLAAQMYNKAYRMGMLDPDSFTQKMDDFTAKIDRGQILSPIYDWHTATFEKNMLAKDPNTIAGFQVIPVEGTTYWADTVYPGGWDACFTTIPKTSKDPAGVMRVIDLLSGFEGARLAYSGIEGVHWNYVNSVPKLTDDVIKAFIEGSEEFDKIGAAHVEGTLQTITGPGMGDICPDGGLVDLFMSPDVYKLSNRPTDKDFSNYYGAEYPMGVFAKKFDEGTIFTHQNDIFDMRVVTGMGAAPEDISRIDVRLNDIALKAIPKIVMAGSEAEFQTLKAEVLSQLNSAGAAESRKWWQSRHDELTKIFTGR